MATTRLSSKGQVVIPKRVRERHGWRTGLELEVEDLGDGVVLRPARRFPRTTLAQLRGCLGYTGPHRSIEDMEAAIAEGAKESR